MDPAELHSDYLQNRFGGILEESARQRELPSLRQRLAYTFQAFAQWLEPNLKTPQQDSELTQERFQKRATS